jgi:hypothetical protein
MSEWNGEGMRFLDIHFLDVGHSWPKSDDTTDV